MSANEPKNIYTRIEILLNAARDRREAADKSGNSQAYREATAEVDVLAKALNQVHVQPW